MELLNLVAMAFCIHVVCGVLAALIVPVLLFFPSVLAMRVLSGVVTGFNSSVLRCGPSVSL
jgi:hypothetical protein